MIVHNWLPQYKTEEGIVLTFKRIKRRTKFESNIENAPQELLKHKKEFNADLKLFFPDLIDFVKKQEEMN